MLVRIFSNGRFPVNNKILQAPYSRFSYFPLRPLPFVKRVEKCIKEYKETSHIHYGEAREQGIIQGAAASSSH
jgi:hypothetical protein